MAMVPNCSLVVPYRMHVPPGRHGIFRIGAEVAICGAQPDHATEWEAVRVSVGFAGAASRR
jgi:hypothetical protein